MKKLNLNKIVSTLGFLLLLLFVFFRENLLLEINAILAQKDWNRAYNFWFADFFMSLPKEDLIIWKSLVSISFTILIAFFTLFSLHYWFQDIRYTKFLIKLYLLVAGLIVLIAIVAYLTGNFNTIYPLLRRIFGVIHSPIPLFIFFLLKKVTK
ncbi:MAG: hypothetical protein COA97_06745 [Flavobacteriales bacterium]|nr:MAG: hypothetical protein COA97_06745 [Flavobacteriales bacterium]